MTRSSKLYMWVLLLYPEPFRMEFGDEMLQMFAECRAAQGSLHLLADVLFSAARQQIYYLLVPTPKNAPRYAEIAPSPALARILAIAMFCVGMLFSAWVRGNSELQKSWPTPCGLSRVAGNLTIKQNAQFGSEAWAPRE